MTSDPTHKHTSSPAAASGPSQPGSPDGPTPDLFGPPPARASRSRKPGSNAVLLMNGICGPTYFDSSATSGPLSSWENRLRDRLGMVGSTESALIWREKVTPAGRSISRLAPWTPPHIRNRLYWCAVAEPDVISGRPETGRCDGAQTGDAHGPHTMVDAARLGWREGGTEPELRSGRHAAAVADAPCDLGDAFDARLERQPRHGNAAGRRQVAAGSVAAPDGGYVADADHDGQPAWERDDPATRYGHSSGAAHGGNGQSFWSGAEWIACHDGKARRTQSGLRLLVDGLPGRVDLWRIAGNAIVPELAAQFLAAIMETS